MSAEEFDWLTLDEGEEVVWSARPELVGYAWAIAIGVLTSVLGVGLLILAWTYLHVQNTAFVVTTEGVYRKTGILSRNVTDIGHGKIQDTSYRQGIVGRHYDVGTVAISTAGGSGVEMQFQAVADPRGVQSTLDDVARAADRNDRKHEDAGAEAVHVDAETMDQLVAELRATREALESVERKL